MLDLPPELLLRVLCELPVRDALRLAETCKALHRACEIDQFWEEKIRRDYGLTSLPKTDDGRPSLKNFYKLVLHQYGKLLGLWQLTSLREWGALFQVSYGHRV